MIRVYIIDNAYLLANFLTFQDTHANSLEKKGNLELLEKEDGLSKFLPPYIISSTKPKNLKKSLQQNFKKYGNLSEVQCCLQFLELLLNKWRKYHQETYDCQVGVSQVTLNQSLMDEFKS